MKCWLLAAGALPHQEKRGNPKKLRIVLRLIR